MADRYRHLQHFLHISRVQEMYYVLSSSLAVVVVVVVGCRPFLLLHILTLACRFSCRTFLWSLFQLLCPWHTFARQQWTFWAVLSQFYMRFCKLPPSDCRWPCKHDFNSDYHLRKCIHRVSCQLFYCDFFFFVFWPRHRCRFDSPLIFSARYFVGMLEVVQKTTIRNRPSAL